MKPMSAIRRKEFSDNLNLKIDQLRQEKSPTLINQPISKNGWQEPFLSPLVTVHAALLRTGKVLFIAGSATDLRIFEQTCPNPNTTSINSCPADPNDTTVCPPWGLTDSCTVWDPNQGTFSRPPVPLDNTGNQLIFSVLVIRFYLMVGY